MPTNGKLKPVENNDQVFILKLYNDHKRLMLYIASKYTDDPANIEDIVQEALLRLMKNISVLQDLPCYILNRYIVLTVRSVFLDMQKKHRHELVLSLEDEKLEAILYRELLYEDSTSELEAKLDVSLLRKELPERDWILLEGKYMKELSDDQLGQLIGVSANSVRMLLSRAKKKAKDILLGCIEKGGGSFE